MVVPAPVEDAGIYRGVQIWWLPYMNRYRFTYEEEEYEVFTLAQAYAKIDELLAPEEPEVPEVPLDEEPPIEPEIPPVGELELPALPWYVAWLKPVIEYIGLLTESVANFFAPIFSPISSVATFIANLPRNMVVGVIDGMKSLLKEARSRTIDGVVKTTKEVAEGSPQWSLDLQSGLESMYEPLVEGFLEATNIETFEESPLPPAEAAAALNKWRLMIVGKSVAMFVIHALAEAGTLGQWEAIKEIDPMVIGKLGIDKLAERATMIPFEKSILLPAEHFYNTQYPTEIPTYADLINMVVKEVITLDRFKTEMLKHGFKEEWSQFIWDAHFRPPDWTQILNAYYRGAITKEDLEPLKILVDLDPRYDAIWNAMIEVIPPYSDLVRMRVKEIISPEDFSKYLQWHGFDPEWGERIYQASLVPPSLGDILTAWRRGIIDEDRVDELMILVDLDPRFKEIFDVRKHLDPSLTLARYMFETGAIEEDRVREIVQRVGYLPEDIESITTFITKFQERRWRFRYLVALQTGIVHEAFTPEELTKAVLDAGLTEATAEWMIKTAEVRKTIAETKAPAARVRALTVADLRKAFLRDVITEDVYTTQLLTRGYEVADVDILVQVLKGDKVTEEAGGRKIALSQSELLNAWRYEEITEDFVSTELQLRGLTLDEVNILLATKKKQWGVA